MSSEEKRAWVYAVVAVAVPAVYFAIVLPGVDVATVSYVGPMLVAIGVAVVANIALTIAATVVRPREAGRKDERDRGITRLGNSAGFFAMSAVSGVALVLAMVEVPLFWIAQALYLAFVVAALASAVARIVAYRRGF
jgi:phosphatidylglycerophosphate synthase